MVPLIQVHQSFLVDLEAQVCLSVQEDRQYQGLQELPSFLQFLEVLCLQVCQQYQEHPFYQEVLPHLSVPYHQLVQVDPVFQEDQEGLPFLVCQYLPVLPVLQACHVNQQDQWDQADQDFLYLQGDQKAQEDLEDQQVHQFLWLP